MIILITGGSSSGKSLLAEQLSTRLKQGKLYYIATMKVWDEECRKRVKRHQEQRAEKEFITVECPSGLARAVSDFEKGVALLDCVGNLMANEMFEEKTSDPVGSILEGIRVLSQKLRHFVLVSNEIFTDGAEYEGQTARYLRNMGITHQKITELADVVIEVCCGIPIIHKGREKLDEINC